MASTPEGKVKDLVKQTLALFAENITVDGMAVKTLKQFWPVPSGFGASDLDVICCYHGVYFAIETKAPGKHPTPRQKLTAAETKGAGGIVFIIDGLEGCKELREFLQDIKDRHDGNS